MLSVCKKCYSSLIEQLLSMKARAYTYTKAADEQIFFWKISREKILELDYPQPNKYYTASA